MTAAPTPPSPEERCSYAAFGEAFFARAVTAERIRAGVSGLSGDPIAFGPIGVGPGRMVRVTAKGEVGEPDVEPLQREEVAFRLTIPVVLALEVDIGVDVHRFHATVAVGLDLVARAAPPLRVVIDIDPPSHRDVTVEVAADGRRAAILQKVAGVDQEIRRFVAKFVARELEKPHIVRARDIDVAARIDHAWRA